MDLRVPSNVHPAEEAKTVSREASQCDPLFLRVLHSRQFEGSSCLCTATCQNALFPSAACCKETVSSHEVSQGSDAVRIFCNVVGDIFSTFASLAFANVPAASAVELLSSWQLFASTFFMTWSCHGEEEMMSVFGSKRSS